MYIYDDSQIFRMIQPFPLTQETKLPCVIQFIQDQSPMGRFNRESQEVELVGINQYIFRYHDQRIWLSGITFPLSHFQVVALHCPQGTLAWAGGKLRNLEMIQDDQGNRYMMHRGFEGVYSGSKQKYQSLQEFLLLQSGLKIYYGERTYSTVDIQKLTPGYWYVLDDGVYGQFQRRQKSFNKFRAAGNREIIFKDIATNVKLHGASLQPDYSSVEPGQSVLLSGIGQCRVLDKAKTNSWWIRIMAVDTKAIYLMTQTGRMNFIDKYPSVFNSFQHFVAYHKQQKTI